jgi:hypothetical protein
MEKTYWLSRKRAARVMARNAASSEARLFHYEMAGRYSIKAAYAPPFMLPRKGPANDGEREVIAPPPPKSPRLTIIRKLPWPRGHKPGDSR